MFRLVVSLYHLLELFLNENESFRHCLAEPRQPRKKNTPYFLDLAGVKFLLKKERVFFFRGSALQVFGQCVGLQCGLGFAKTIFWGKGFGKTSANFCFCILSARRRCGGNSARRAQSVPFGYFQTDTAFWLKSELTLTSIRTRNEPPR